MSESASTTAKVCNSKGLHARPASKCAKLADSFDAEIIVACNGERAEANSIMDLLMLGAAPGSELAIEARGPDAEAASAAFADFVRRGFDET